MVRKSLDFHFSELSKYFFEDPEALQLIDGLRERANFLKMDEGLLKEARDARKAKQGQGIGDKSSHPSLFYPIPPEVKKSKGSYVLFTDGACRGNPGPGAFGLMAQSESGDILFEASGVEMKTTNNRMEMMAVIEGLQNYLRYFKENQIAADQRKVFCYSDSRYVVDGITKWVPGWKRRNWKKADNAVPENLEYWQQLDALKDHFPFLQFLWVKGHSGHPQNERCDQLANFALDDAGY